ncbi:MAG: hypothetical protein FWD52_01965 [Candidatus Bathyarchaeota archaeon]|nr:hypothetical protein [Candidatus Termiticorpusculum sp.]
MGYRPRTRSSKKITREYRKVFREKNKPVKQNSYDAKYVREEKLVTSQQQVFEVTLKRLHTLGNQKFGSSPFSEHFDRWLRTVETVLDEFETHPNIKIDQQFTEERKQALETIKLQFGNYREKELTLEKQVNDLSNTKKRLQQINKEYLTKICVIREQKMVILRRLNNELEILKKEQDQIVKLKTGFFRGISKKEREQKEVMVVQRYVDKQHEFEVVALDFKEKQKRLKVECENKRDLLLEDEKDFQKCVKEMEEDSSLEERWLTCEVLKDVLNNFFQRK